MATYKQRRYLFMATDPVHVGTGGYRLGRVDNSIVREPGTRIPKIPGTSLHGAARAYAAQLYEEPAAAGQNQKGIQNPSNDPVCYTFGFIKEENGSANGYSGVVNVFDAHVLLFPVHSMVGPVWVSTITRLREAGFTVENSATIPDINTVLVTWERKDAINLGWLMLNVGKKISVANQKIQEESYWKSVKDRIVLVSDALFSQVVNSNLEIRTSVAIDPERGAAEDKALFTYEALPRTTFLTTEVVLDDYRDGANGRPFPKDKTAKKNPLPGEKWKNPLDVLDAGLRMIEWLGVGGMGTRGFGRMAVVGKPLEKPYGEKEWQ